MVPNSREAIEQIANNKIEQHASKCFNVNKTIDQNASKKIQAVTAK